MKNNIKRLVSIFKAAADEVQEQVELFDYPDHTEQYEVLNDLEQKTLEEAKNSSTALNRLAQIAKLNKAKLSMPAKLTFLKVVESKQHPMYDYARDLLNLRVPGMEDVASDYPSLKEDLKTMSEEQVSEDKYGTLDSLFGLWSMALNKAATKKFKGKKGKGRGQMYDSPVTLTTNPAVGLKPVEVESIYDSPHGDYTRQISSPSK